MAQFMVIETYLNNCTNKIYEWFHNNGKMFPEGLKYFDSCLTKMNQLHNTLMRSGLVPAKSWRQMSVLGHQAVPGPKIMKVGFPISNRLQNQLTGLDSAVQPFDIV